MAHTGAVPKATNQLSEARTLIQSELVPRLVVFDEDAHQWVCQLCGWRTTQGPKHMEALLAKHGTYCKLGKVIGVVE